MTITISAEDSRSIKAIEIAAAGASQWLKVPHARRAEVVRGAVAVEVRRYHLADTANCDGQDSARHPGQPCNTCWPSGSIASW